MYATRFAIIRRCAYLSAAILVLAQPTVAHAAPAAPIDIPRSGIGALQQLTDREADRYAGLYLDQSHHVLRVFVTQAHQDTARSAVQSLAKARQATATDQLRVELVPVERSMRDLADVMTRVDTQEPWASMSADLRSAWYADPATNRVRVGLTSVTPELRAAAAKTFGDTVELVQHDRMHTMMREDVLPRGKKPRVTDLSGTAAPVRNGALAQEPTRLLDAVPYYSGTRIYRTYVRDGQNYVGQCTTAFVVQSFNVFRMATAGHCSPLNTTWQQGYYNTTTQQLFRTGTMGVMTSRQFGNNLMDGAIISNGSYYPGIYAGTLDTTTWPIAGQRGAVAGETICAAGSFTRGTCGVGVYAVNACLNLFDEQTNATVRVCNQALSNAATGTTRIVQAGDSGGPVFEFAPTINEVRAMGIISGGSENGRAMNFTQLQNFTSQFGAPVVVSP